jgi:hypothetical protein
MAQFEPEEINRRFSIVEDDGEKMQLTQEILSLAGLINLVAPDGRRKAVALTELEAVRLWTLHALDE